MYIHGNIKSHQLHFIAVELMKLLLYSIQTIRFTMRIIIIDFSYSIVEN